MQSVKQSYLINQEEFEYVGQCDIPEEYFDGVLHPAVAIFTDGRHVVVDLARNNAIIRDIPDQDTSYGVLEAEFVEVA